MPRKEQKRGRSRERRSPSVSSCDIEITVNDVIQLVESKASWHDVLRDPFLFEENFFSDHLDWIKEIFETKKLKNDSKISNE